MLRRLWEKAADRLVDVALGIADVPYVGPFLVYGALAVLVLSGLFVATFVATFVLFYLPCRLDFWLAETGRDEKVFVLCASIRWMLTGQDVLGAGPIFLIGFFIVFLVLMIWSALREDGKKRDG